MGPVQVRAANPAFARFPAHGTATTRDFFSGITDSAAAATAIATGHKTASGVVAMDPLGILSYTSVAELARDAGMRVGVVTTVSLDHATPAAFYAKSRSRSDYYGIASQIPSSGMDYFGGGGLVAPQGPGGGSPDVFAALRTTGYRVISTRMEFESLFHGSGRCVVMNETLDASACMPYDLDRKDDDLSLADFVAKGITLLRGEDGFLLVVEGGKIDFACHANDSVRAIGEIRALDRAVAKAMEFASRHPAESLVVVTADHETGGMTLGPEGAGWTMTGHTSTPVPIYASGVGMELFARDCDNTDIFSSLVIAMGLQPMSAMRRSSVPRLTRTWSR